MSLRRMACRGASTLGALLTCAAVLLLTLPQVDRTDVALTSGSATFTITGVVHAWSGGAGPARQCSGPQARLHPGVTRCVVFGVQNSMREAITVRRIAMDLDPSFPAPPAGCSADKLSLPQFRGALRVRAGGHALSPGQPITLKDTRNNQNNCQQTVLHFVFSGAASYGERPGSAPTTVMPSTGTELTRSQLVGGLIAGVVLFLAGLTLLRPARDRKDERA